VALVLALVIAAPARAQVADLELGSTIFVEPSPDSKLTVLTPSAALGVTPVEWLTLDLGWEADVVSGATESLKAGPISGADVISSATSFDDTRHVLSAGFRITRETTHLSAAFSYGTEKDYRSRAITVSAGTDFLQKNTQIELSYARGFDEVCTTAYPNTRAPSERDALDSSAGCFTNADDRASRDIDLDNLQAAWTQTWTPVFSTQVVLTGALQHGFLENPYREVVISPANDTALENQPDNRARGALALRARYYAKPIQTAFGAGIRGYRDTWDVLSQTYELEAERYIFPWLRILARGRFYNQSGALFWSDDYTGGEPKYGPRGQYWSGDRELSPLHSYLVGGRLMAGWQGRPGARIAGMLLEFELGASLDFMKTELEDFTWGGIDPNDTAALIGGASIHGSF
jgi:hypothetical protein